MFKINTIKLVKTVRKHKEEIKTKIDFVIENYVDYRDTELTMYTTMLESRTGPIFTRQFVDKAILSKVRQLKMKDYSSINLEYSKLLALLDHLDTSGEYLPRNFTENCINNTWDWLEDFNTFWLEFNKTLNKEYK